MKNLSPSRISNRLVLYGIFLVASGMVGFLLTNEESSSSIVNGIVSGTLMVALGFIYRSGRPWTLPAAFSATTIFILTFVWRGIVKWHEVISGNVSELPIAVLLTVMFVISAIVAMMLLRIIR